MLIVFGISLLCKPFIQLAVITQVTRGNNYPLGTWAWKEHNHCNKSHEQLTVSTQGESVPGRNYTYNEKKFIWPCLLHITRASFVFSWWRGPSMGWVGRTTNPFDNLESSMKHADRDKTWIWHRNGQHSVTQPRTKTSWRALGMRKNLRHLVIR